MIFGMLIIIFLWSYTEAMITSLTRNSHQQTKIWNVSIHGRIQNCRLGVNNRKLHTSNQHLIVRPKTMTVVASNRESVSVAFKEIHTQRCVLGNYWKRLTAWDALIWRCPLIEWQPSRKTCSYFRMRSLPFHKKKTYKTVRNLYERAKTILVPTIFSWLLRIGVVSLRF